jgi:hypothetical protein
MKVAIMGKKGLKILDFNRRKAIHERCLNCSTWNPYEVTECTFLDCPLYSFRTGKGRQNPKKRQQAIKSYCLWCMAGQSSEISKCVSVNCPLFTYRLKEIDRSIEIDSGAQNVHIEPISEIKTERGISLYG